MRKNALRFTFFILQRWSPFEFQKSYIHLSFNPKVTRLHKLYKLHKLYELYKLHELNNSNLCCQNVACIILSPMNRPTLASRLKLRERPAGRSPVMFQTWQDLLFLHWEYDVDEIQQTLPPGLYVDTFEERAYLGIVPFFMKNVRPRFCPNVPGISNFMETNLRTYVYDERGIAGVWFYSLDANQWLAVKLARTFFKLPYFYAAMHEQRDQSGQVITYDVGRRGVDQGLHSRFCYQSAGSIRHAQPGTLEFFLVERYILFAYSAQTRSLSTGQVYHTPYPIIEAEVSEWDSYLLEIDGFSQPLRAPDHILMSPGVTVDIFALAQASS